MRSLFLQDEDGQILEATRSAPVSTTRASVPSTRCSRRTGRAEYDVRRPTTRRSPGFQLLAATEGIVPALEPAHAIGWLAREAGRSVPAGSTVLVTLSGRGDKDAAQVAETLGRARER